MNISFERVTSLEYHFKAAVAEIEAFKYGKKYKSMEEKYEKEICSLKRKRCIASTFQS